MAGGPIGEGEWSVGVVARTQGVPQGSVIGPLLANLYLHYCKDSNRRGTAEHIQFDFLGYTFMPRMARNSIRKVWFTNWLPAVSKKLMNQRMKGWGVLRTSTLTLTQVAHAINPVIRGWINYYGKFYNAKYRNFMHILNVKLASWARRKYKNLRSSEMKAIRWLHGISRTSPNLFAHWTMGSRPTNENNNRSRMTGDRHSLLRI